MLSAATTTSSPDLAASLREIGMRKTADSLDDLISRATRSRMPLTAVLDEIVRSEKADRTERSLAARLEAARLGRFKPMADFEWDWPKKIDREAIERSLHLGFLEKTENIVLVANQGLGKSMIARNIAHAAVLAGHTALCVSASEMLLDLGTQPTAALLHRRLRRYTRPSVLAVDELGYISYDNHAADLLFRYHQLRLLRLVHHLPQRRLRRRAHRPSHPPLRGHRYRRRQLPEARGRTCGRGPQEEAAPMTSARKRRFYYAPISRDQWLRICSLARLWDSHTESASERVVERALDVIEAEEGEALKRCDTLWKARFALRRRLGEPLR